MASNSLSIEVKKLIQHKFDSIEEDITPGDYQRDFFDSLQEQWTRKEWLSEKQLESLDKIYERITQ